MTDKGHFIEVNPLQWALRRFTDVGGSVYFPFICEGSANEFQCTDQKSPRIDILNAAKLINVSNQCIFFLIRSSRLPTFCGIFVCGPLQFKVKRQFISPLIGYYRGSGFDSKLKRHQLTNSWHAKDARACCGCFAGLGISRGGKKQKVIKAGKSFIILNELLALKT